MYIPRFGILQIHVITQQGFSLSQKVIFSIYVALLLSLSTGKFGALIATSHFSVTSGKPAYTVHISAVRLLIYAIICKNVVNAPSVGSGAKCVIGICVEHFGALRVNRCVWERPISWGFPESSLRFSVK